MFENIFSPVHTKELTENFFSAFDDEWMLITAGTPSHYNTMTASWGSVGILWNKPVAMCFIRPQRYTFGFVEESGHFTLTFLEPGSDEILDYCGSYSGRDTDKATQTGLQPLETPAGSVSFKQARLVLECRKLYADFLKPDNFVDRKVMELTYPKNDFHRFFIGEIVGCWRKGTKGRGDE